MGLGCMPKRWDLLQDTQGRIALFLAEVDLEKLIIRSDGGIFHTNLEVGEEDLYLFICPDYRLVCDLTHAEQVSPGNLFLREEGEDPLEIRILRYTLYSGQEWLQNHIPRRLKQKKELARQKELLRNVQTDL
jgi:hypothetical protein